jgi:Protein of unknown function (DUF2946)
MDEQVLSSLIKWPSVPVCTNWLAFNRRGDWLMRNEFAQINRLPGEVIKHRRLIEFIERNYAVDSMGKWFFQNGPQRVYVDLDYTPFISRIHIENQQKILKTTLGQEIKPEQCWMDENGQIILRASIAVQRLINESNSTFRLEKHSIATLLHDHDLDFFSETAQFHSACGSLGVWEWHGKSFEIEALHSQEIKKIIASYPVHATLDDTTLESVWLALQFLRLDKNQHHPPLWLNAFVQWLQSRLHWKHTFQPMPHIARPSCLISCMPLIADPIKRHPQVHSLIVFLTKKLQDRIALFSTEY